MLDRYNKMYQIHSSYSIKIIVFFCFRSSKQLFFSAFTITLLSIFSLFRMLQSSIVIPNRSVEHLVCDNWPILIMSHFVNHKIKHKAVAGITIQWLATSCRVWGLIFVRGNRCYLDQNWMGGCSCNSLSTWIEFKNEWNCTTGPPYAFMAWTGTTLSSILL